MSWRGRVRVPARVANWRRRVPGDARPGGDDVDAAECGPLRLKPESGRIVVVAAGDDDGCSRLANAADCVCEHPVELGCWRRMVKDIAGNQHRIDTVFANDLRERAKHLAQLRKRRIAVEASTEVPVRGVQQPQGGILSISVGGTGLSLSQGSDIRCVGPPRPAYFHSSGAVVCPSG